MEPKFINEYAVTLELYKEWSNNPVGKAAIRNRKKRRLLCAAGVIWGFLILAFGYFQQEYYAVALGIGFILLFTLWVSLMPAHILKKQYDTIMKARNGRPWVRTITFSDAIAAQDANASSRYEYAEIVSITQSDAYFYLFVNEDMVIRVRKDSFIQGSCDEFRQFISSAIQK